ncbi:MAG: alpha-hydroxy-acid oxidizing protein [marine benthic group bacterium]|nr:alpha-hydroxy-acid oxidizing protein [Gemmatimonadota bacterium]
MSQVTPLTRRSFARFLAGSPLLPLLGFSACAPGEPRDSTADATLRELSDLIGSPDDAINVFDFRDVARKTLPPAHYGYMATGVDGDETLRANRKGFGRFDLRARRLVDVSSVDTGVELLGERWDTPIVLAPAGSQKAFHPDGEMAAARASTALGHHQILSTVTTTSVEDLNAVRNRPVWYQLYPTSNWSVTQALLRRAEGAGCQALVLTVDLPVDSNRETLRRSVKADTRDCSTCHDAGPTGWFSRKPMFEGLDVQSIAFDTPWMTWDFIGRLRDETDMRILVKGIVRGDDALRCVQYGADGIVVSNHGGRAEASGRSSIESLPEVVAAVAGRVPVLVDGGFRRGTDILKALALGADSICIGRPYLWGMAAFGQAGVEKVLEILQAELQLAMQLHGVPSLADLDSSFVVSS